MTEPNEIGRVNEGIQPGEAVGAAPVNGGARAAVAKAVAAGEVAQFYGNPFAEQQAFTEGFGLAWLGEIGVLRVTGADRYSWLNSLSSQQFPNQVSTGFETLFMDANGHVLWACGVIDEAAGGGLPGGIVGAGGGGDSAGGGGAADAGSADDLDAADAGAKEAAGMAGADRLTRAAGASMSRGIVRGVMRAAGQVTNPVPATGAASAEQAIWLITDPRGAAGLREHLESMRFMLRVEVEDYSSEYRVFAAAKHRVKPGEIAGKLAAGSADSAGSPADNPADSSGVAIAASDLPDLLVWQDPWPGVTPGGTRYFLGSHPASLLPLSFYLVKRTQAEAFGVSWLAAVNRALAAGDFETETAQLVGLLAFEATRVAAWRPRSFAEVDEKSTAPELDWLRTAAHMDKGCYPGQETVARIINLGKPARRLTFLWLDGSAGDLPQPGAAISLTEGGRPIGKITSVANHFEMGPIALALLRRSIDPQVVLQVALPEEGEFVSASQELIVPVEGKAEISPQVRPGSDLRQSNSRSARAPQVAAIPGNSQAAQHHKGQQRGLQ